MRRWRGGSWGLSQRLGKVEVDVMEDLFNIEKRISVLLTLAYALRRGAHSLRRWCLFIFLTVYMIPLS